MTAWFRLIIVPCLALAACSPVPDLAQRNDPALAEAEYPAFLTTAQLRTLTATDPAADRAVETGLQGRAAALQARAQRLRGDAVVDPDARKRLDEAVATN